MDACNAPGAQKTDLNVGRPFKASALSLLAARALCHRGIMLRGTLEGAPPVAKTREVSFG